MGKTPFDADVRAEGGAMVVDLHGDVDGTVQAELDAAFDEAAGAGKRTVLLNFGDVHYINSTGIALIVGLLARATVAGRDVGAYGLSEHYRHIFEITRLSDFMSIHTDEPGALAAAGA